MRIKLSTLNSPLHESNLFSKENEDFIKEIELRLHEKIEVSPIDDYDCDMKLIFIASGGSEGLFLEKLPKLKEPFYFLTKGTNNSLAASLEIMTYLNIHNLKGEVLHGSVSYIVDRINNINDKVVKKEELVRLGVIGKPSDWLISSIPDYKEIKRTFGIELIEINLDEVVFLYNSKLKKYETSIDTKGFNPEEIRKADAFSEAIKEIVSLYKLEGLTIRCFDLLTKIKTTGCHALATINKLGVVGTCEGDIMALVSMYLVKKVFGKSSFQANPSVIDIENKEIVFAHCTLPYDMCESYQYMTHFESKIGVAIRGKLEKRRIGVFRISSNLKDFYFDTGEIIENLEEENLCRTQIRVKMDNDVSKLLTNPCGNHHIIFYL